MYLRDVINDKLQFKLDVDNNKYYKSNSLIINNLSMNTALVCGAGGFIGSHLVKRLKKEGYWVRGIDLKLPEYAKTEADDFIVGDLRNPEICRLGIDQPFDEVYQLAADMGGAGFVFTGENDADIMHNSALINLNMIEVCRIRKVKKIFYSSSA